jgi:hypothetical protein
MKPLLPLLLGVAFVASSWIAVPAHAAPKRVNGNYCHFPNVKSGTYVGFFDGYGEAFDVFRLRDTRDQITVWRCFKTKADCNAWKYWMQTDYAAGPRVTWCRKK